MVGVFVERNAKSGNLNESGDCGGGEMSLDEVKTKIGIAETAVLAIYKAYFGEVGFDQELALRLTFIAVQYLANISLTWPGKK